MEIPSHVLTSKNLASLLYMGTETGNIENVLISMNVIHFMKPIQMFSEIITTKRPIEMAASRFMMKQPFYHILATLVRIPWSQALKCLILFVASRIATCVVIGSIVIISMPSNRCTFLATMKTGVDPALKTLTVPRPSPCLF